MEQARSYPLKRKVRIILPSSFPVFKKLEVGDKGLMEVFGIVDGKRIDPDSSGTEMVIQNITITNTEKLEVSNGGRK